MASFASADATSSSAKACAAARRSFAVFGRHAPQPLENLELEPKRALAGIGDLGFGLAELGGGEAHLSGQRLAVDELSR